MLLKTIDSLREPVAALTAEMIYPITCEGLRWHAMGHQRGRKCGKVKSRMIETALSHWGSQVRTTAFHDLLVVSVMIKRAFPRIRDRSKKYEVRPQDKKTVFS